MASLMLMIDSGDGGESGGAGVVGSCGGGDGLFG